MCLKFLKLISSLYLFNKKITRDIYVKLTFLITIIFFVIFFAPMAHDKSLLVSSVFILLLSPISIYQWISKENPLFGRFNIVVCISEIFWVILTIIVLINYIG